MVKSVAKHLQMGNSTGKGLITYKGNVKTKASGSSSDKDKDNKSESKQVFWFG